MSDISFRIWCEICRTYGTQAAWVVGAADRRVETRRYKFGRVDGISEKCGYYKASDFRWKRGY